MFRLMVVACLAYVTVAMPFRKELDSEWNKFKAAYNKQYMNEDYEMYRRLVWERNVQYIEDHNLEADRGNHTFWLGVNEYADMTVKEFVKAMNGFNSSANPTSQCGTYMEPNNVKLSDLPKSVDWRTKGYVTAIKDQGQCGSCWAFSSTGSLEGQHFRKTGDLVSLSEKNLMDCSKDEGNEGCSGGLMDQAFRYVIKNDGIDTEASYPYVPKDGPCKFKAADVGAKEVSCKDIKQFSESNLQKAVATEGPISVAIDASHSSFQLYKRGVYKEPECSQTELDHGVLAVGYGAQQGDDYWLVKNSWGKSWGEKGYIYMARNNKNMCGIATMASFPTM